MDSVSEEELVVCVLLEVVFVLEVVFAWSVESDSVWLELV